MDVNTKIRFILGPLFFPPSFGKDGNVNHSFLFAPLLLILFPNFFPSEYGDGTVVSLFFFFYHNLAVFRTCLHLSFNLPAMQDVSSCVPLTSTQMQCLLRLFSFSFCFLYVFLVVFSMFSLLFIFFQGCVCLFWFTFRLIYLQ